MKVEQAHNNVQWKKVKLGEVCVPSSEKYNPLTENLFQYCIEMENINQESGTLNGKSDIAKLLSLKTKFHKGEVLYGKLRPYLRKYWLADFDGACSTEIWVLKNAENIDNRFLFYLFQSESINKIANLSSGTKMPRADWRFMEKQTVSIPFKNNKPDLSAQRRIAAILASADKVIAATQKTIAKYKQMKQGMMEDLLKPKEGWKMVKLGEIIVDSYAGGTPNRGRGDYFGGDIPWVSSGEVNNPEINSTFENITIEGLNNSSAKWIPENSILVALYGATAGQVSMLRIRATSNQAVLAIIPNDEVADTMFLYYQIVYNKENLLFLAQGSGQPNLSKNLVDKLEISIPDLTEQQRIASILSGIDAKIAAEEKVLEKYGKIKKGLMERMLESKN